MVEVRMKMEMLMAIVVDVVGMKMKVDDIDDVEVGFPMFGCVVDEVVIVLP